jgi:subtilase family serine protease
MALSIRLRLWAGLAAGVLAAGVLAVAASAAAAGSARASSSPGPNTDPGFIDAFFSAASQNTADTLSTSWGESETIVASAVAAGQETTDWSVTATPPVVSGGGSGRAVPDLSADADPYSGYLLYEPSAVAAGGQALEGGWGGTSFIAPQFNGSTAVIDSYLGHRVGFWNPSLYAFAAGPDSPVTPLNQVGTGNDNIFYTGNPGELFNEATGLGVPNLAAFARDLGAQR